MALLTFQSGDSVKQALYDELLNLMNADKDIRTKAEVKVKHLEFTEGYGVFLAEFIMNQSFDFPLRQMACVMLTKYVETHWHDEENRPAVVTTQAKDMIRKVLPNGLYDSSSKIRASVAFAISTIASTEWPAVWTDLFDIIVKCLGGNEDSIHGAMQVLVEFTYDLDSQISAVGPVILNEIYRIFNAEETYSVKTRTCSVTIFKSVLSAINENVPSKAEKSKLLDPVLPVFINKLVLALGNPSLRQTSFEMKTEIIKVLTYMINDMTKFVHQYHDQIFPSVWQLLTQMADIYVKVVVNEIDSPFESTDDDDELGNFSALIIQVYEFIHSIVEHVRFKPVLKSVITDLVYISIVYMQITEDQVVRWEDDPESFTDDFSDVETAEFSIRSTSTQLLISLTEELGPEIVLPAFSEALKRHLQVAMAEKNADNPNWWKVNEAAMSAFGTIKKFFLHENPAANTLFNAREYLPLVRSMLGASENGSGYQKDVSPYLHNRALWTLSVYSNIAPDIYDRPQLQAILDTVSNNMNNQMPDSVQIMAIKSLQELCLNLKKTVDQRCMVLEKLPVFLDFITDIGARNTGSVLYDLLTAISVIASFDKEFTATNHVRLISFTIAIFLRSYQDPFVLESVQEIITALSENEFCIVPLQERLIPTMISVLNRQQNAQEDGSHLLQDTAMLIISSIVKHSPLPLSPILVNTAFPVTIKCIMSTDDHEILQSGGECLRAFISASPEQICSYNNGEGLDFIMRATTLLLNPMLNEHTAAFVGRLVVTIVTKAANYLGENVNMLLKAVISKMQLVESLSVSMSLVTTFAHLFVTQMDAVLNFLSTVPGPTGEPAMQFVLNVWLPRQPSFYGTYERKISTIALCKIFEYGITSNDTRITSIKVRDVVDIANVSNKPRTRSQQACIQQMVEYPVLVKILKLLISELGFMEESILDGEDYSEDDEEDAEDADGQNAAKGFRVSDIYYGDDEGPEPDDELLSELESDPMYKGDIKEKLRTFLQHFISSEQFGEFVQYLSEQEQTRLRCLQTA